MEPNSFLSLQVYNSLSLSHNPTQPPTPTPIMESKHDTDPNMMQTSQFSVWIFFLLFFYFGINLTQYKMNHKCGESCNYTIFFKKSFVALSLKYNLEKRYSIPSISSVRLRLRSKLDKMH